MHSISHPTLKRIFSTEQKVYLTETSSSLLAPRKMVPEHTAPVSQHTAASVSVCVHLVCNIMRKLRGMGFWKEGAALDIALMNSAGEWP